MKSANLRYVIDKGTDFHFMGLQDRSLPSQDDTVDVEVRVKNSRAVVPGQVLYRGTLPLNKYRMLTASNISSIELIDGTKGVYRSLFL